MKNNVLKEYYNKKSGLYEIRGKFYTQEEVDQMTNFQKNSLATDGWAILEGERCSDFECKYQNNNVCTRPHGGYGVGVTCWVAKYKY